MYSAAFYPFETEEERWAYMSRHILINRFDGVTALYQELYRLVQDHPYFVITTNVDGQFLKAGFDKKRLFAVQGDYGLLQCAKACHPQLYPNESLVREMFKAAHDCRIPSSLVPRCPVCGGSMAVHIRCDEFFIEDDSWHAQLEAYQRFLASALKAKPLFLELGVGFNTPGIIRFPFERLAAASPRVTLARLNRDEWQSTLELTSFLPFGEDLNLLLARLTE